jgi:PGF-pre-PGF domain-containing protein
MDKRFLVFITLLILLSSSGIGITAAESSGGNSTNTDTVSSELTSTGSNDDNSISDNSVNDTSVDDTSTDNTSIDDVSTDNNSISDESTDNNTGYNTSIDNDSGYSTSTEIDSGINISTENNLTNESELVSAEPQTNIQHTEISQVYINNSQNVNISITNYNSVVNNINFDATKSLGKTTVVVEDLKDKSTLVNNPPAGNIYKSFNIWINNGNVNNNYIKNSIVNFQVEKSWLKKNNFDNSAIVLNRYINGKWVAVPVTITGHNTKYVYFKAKVSGYSSFTITGKTDQATVTTKPIQQVNSNSLSSNSGSQNEIIRLLNEIINRLDEIIKLIK